MKVSQIIGIVVFIILAIAVIIFVQNENKEVKQAFNTSTGKMESYDPETFNRGSGVTRMTESSMEIRKNKERNKILMIGGGILAVVVIGFIITKSNEDKKDPMKNLATLKQKNIISQSEYEEKIEKTKSVQVENKALEIKRKEHKKLLAELDNLKSKGILTEEEYQQKLIKLREKTA